jgi:hypothetical protein
LVAIALSLLLVACSNGGDTPTPTSAPHPAKRGERTGRNHAKSSDCAPTRDVAGPSKSTLQRVATAPAIDAAVYPRPTYTAKQWSQWGQGVVLPDGSYVSALGDHCGRNGDAFVFASDGHALERVADVDEVLDQQPGAWGYGKIHGQAVAMADGNVYLATYWGDRQGIAYGNGYTGDAILRYDPRTRRLTSLGVPVPRHGVPSLAGWAEGGLLYGEAVEPNVGENKGVFFAFDIKTGKTVFTSDEPRHAGFRSVAVSAAGDALFSAGEGKLWRFDPRDRKLREVAGTLPGAWMRAATRPGPDGTIYGVTREPDMLFALKPNGAITSLGAVRGYTASVALSADGKRLYYVPFAAGDGWKEGTPLVEVALASGKQSDVVRLNDTVGKALHLTVGGSYNVAVDATGRRVYVGLNAGPDTKKTFGEVVLAIVDVG